MTTRKLIAGLALLAFSGAAISVPVTLNLLTDDFSGETSFAMFTVPGGADLAYDSFMTTDAGFTDPNNGFVFGGELADFENYSFTWDLGPGDYDFVMFDSFGDGICCTFGAGEYSLSIDGDEIFASDENMNTFDGSEQSTLFSIDDPGVPEPGTLLLVALGLIGIGASRKRLA